MTETHNRAVPAGAAASAAQTSAIALDFPSHLPAANRTRRLWRFALAQVLQHPGMAFAAAAIVAWLCLSLLTHDALMGDNIEQSIWAHSFEWGYYKHPPLPTWFLIAATRLLGPLWWLTDALAALFLLGTALATYALARRLTSARVAQLAIVLWGLHLTLTWRVILYNHNTVLLFLCALLAWAVVAATQDRSLRHWLAAGVFAGLAMLAKYQAGVLILVLIVALAHMGYLSDRFHRKGLLAAAVLAALVFSPHLIWLFNHQFLPLQYASTQLPKKFAPMAQLPVLGFSVQQVRLLWPGLAAVLLSVIFIPRPVRQGAMVRAHRRTCRPTRAWIRYLALAPLAFVLIVGLSGTHLQNHWGLETLQFMCLALAIVIGRRSSVTPRQLMFIAGALHLLLMTTVLHNAYQVHEHGWQGQGDKHYPAQALTQRAVADWQRVTACPLPYVVGPPFEAGTIAVFSGQNPQVFESANTLASPWIDPVDVQRRGAIYVGHSAEELPRGADVTGSMQVTTALDSAYAPVIYWAVVAPVQACPVPPQD